MMRLTMKGRDSAPQDWTQRLSELGMEVVQRATVFDTDALYVVHGDDAVLVEQAPDRCVVTVLAYPSAAQRRIVEQLVQCGVALFAVPREQWR